jgi:hypothetical protein
MATSEPTPCAIDGCPAPAAHADLIALCADHLLLAAEVHGEVAGVTGALPSPCALCRSRIGVRHLDGWTCAVCEWPYGEQPDGDLPPPRVDVVYYLQFDDRVKVGTTASPRQRFTAIRHDRLLAFERGDRTVEQRRHAEFAEERLGTSEWFALSDRLHKHIDVLAGGVDPWDRWRRWVAEATAVR